MTATIIDGTMVAKAIREELRLKIAELIHDGITPGLAVVMLGDDPGSSQYVKMKGKMCQELNMHSQTLRLPGDYSEEELLRLVDELNVDPKIHGILVQMPLPKHISAQKIIDRISPDKDVDGLHPLNVGRMLSGDLGGFLPCTPHGVQELLVRSGISWRGKHVVICGRSNIVGKPLAALLMQKHEDADATVTVCHSHTKDLAHHTRQADIVVSAMGVPHFIKPDMIKEGAVVVDVGVARVEDKAAPKGYRLVGDVEFETVKEKASAITPNPGGVGPMTIIMLMKNTVLASQKARRP